jgi:hypothetical protein
MMTWPRGPASTTDGINWREARYLARVVQMLVTSPADKAEFRRELEGLVAAAEALRAGVPSSRAAGFDGAGHSDPRGLTEGETAGAAEGAVLALWRNRSGGRDRTEKTDPVDEAELARAVEEIERAAAALRVDESESGAAVLARAVEEIERAAAALRRDEPDSAVAVESDAGSRRRPSRVWSQIAGIWISIVAATVAMVAGLLIFMR